ncbi:sigma factor G inhibitor Gin [uncultured Clostridium sp.]|uniref:sigma factor G inhibitor Gin n=1 Tax=uncultured Clostridium sp. TaxID=59620 RepID=UPI00262AEDCF|nr:sigma factor G inhibitor Gin [uncultured Clostridium sp.]
MKFKNIKIEEFKNKEIEYEKDTVCAICGKAHKTGLSEDIINGIIINGEYICRNCEREIVNTRVEENRYDYFIDKIKVVIYK